MTARALSPSRALAVWLIVCMLLGLASGYNRTAHPLLERDRARPRGTLGEWGVLSGKRAGAIEVRDAARRRLLLTAALASLRATPGQVTVDVDLPDAKDARSVEASIRALWRETAATPSAMPIVIVVRDGRSTGETAQAEIAEDACRVVIFLTPSWNARGDAGGYSAGGAALRRWLGLCLFAARYGAPGTAAASLVYGPGQLIEPPCFLRNSEVTRFFCRSQFFAQGRRLTTTPLLRYDISSVSQAACGVGNRDACTRWLGEAKVHRENFWRRYSLIRLYPALEFDLRPEAFARFWKDQRPTAVAYAAASGRRFDDFLKEFAVPASIGYSPRPHLRFGETVAALAVIVLALTATLVSISRRTVGSV